MRNVLMCSLFILSLPLTSFAKRENFKPQKACLSDTHQVKIQGCMRNGTDAIFPLKKNFFRCFTNEVGKTVLEMIVTYRTHGTQDSCAIVTKEFFVSRICSYSPDIIKFRDTDNYRISDDSVVVRKSDCLNLRY